MFHLRDSLEETRYFPSGLKATDKTQASCLLMTMGLLDRLLASHIFTVLSMLEVAIWRSSGLNLTSRIRAEWAEIDLHDAVGRVSAKRRVPFLSTKAIRGTGGINGYGIDRIVIGLKHHRCFLCIHVPPDQLAIIGTAKNKTTGRGNSQTSYLGIVEG